MTAALHNNMAAAAVIKEAAARLAAAGIEAPRREARLLLAEALGCNAQSLFNRPETPVAAKAATAFEKLLARRLAGEPLSRLRGRREFWSLSFHISPATLDPRPDSESLVEAALARLPNRKARLRILDLGAGSGCLLLALLSEYRRAWGLGVDLSVEAAETAAANARALGLAQRASFVTGDWAEALRQAEGSWDLVVSNPPYIATSEIASLEPSVRLHDPRRALDGGEDGLRCYRALAPSAARLLKPGGLLILEIGHTQAEAVESLLRAAGFPAIERVFDLAGRERCLAARR